MTWLTATVLCGAVVVVMVVALAAAPDAATAHPARGDLLDAVRASTMDTHRLVVHPGDHAVDARRGTCRAVDARGRPVTAGTLPRGPAPFEGT
ncbi:hypothetical protein SAMN05216553_113124 [Lentzea fradiae]|uniref:Uncharacterized protein n=1 Tax=Lentzea fradiae TaxID=200378 RepID=A0A1G7Y748_9PSEU|nr:hypothetical protein [Lentzea fradiae]SDG92197.1 hypothetical protein SAMN05216553_113124 [Lentzea fradiae]